MPAYCEPATDLPVIVRAAAAHEVAAVPVKPAARVFAIDPAPGSPDGEGLRCVDAKMVQHRVMALRIQFGVREPVGRELGLAVGHVAAAEDAEREHLLRRKLGMELRMK